MAAGGFTNEIVSAGRIARAMTQRLWDAVNELRVKSDL